MTRDLLYALRYARKHWGPFLASGSLLAIGVGACTIVAGLAYGLLWGICRIPTANAWFTYTKHSLAKLPIKARSYPSRRSMTGVRQMSRSTEWLEPPWDIPRAS